jgi:hypothetical protein
METPDLINHEAAIREFLFRRWPLRKSYQANTTPQQKER